MSDNVSPDLVVDALRVYLELDEVTGCNIKVEVDDQLARSISLEAGFVHGLAFALYLLTDEPAAIGSDHRYTWDEMPPAWRAFHDRELEWWLTL